MIKALRKRRERKEGIGALGEGRDKEKKNILLPNKNNERGYKSGRR